MTPSTVDWNAVSAADTPAADTPAATPSAATPCGGAAGAAKAAAPQALGGATLPEMPEIIGRLPIKTGTGVAIVQLPEPVKGVSCAAVFANSSILSDCDRPSTAACQRPAVKFARPLNDAEIEVVFWDGEDRVVGPGWKTSGYPGGPLETRVVPVGVPFVEVKIVAGRAIQCGCDPDKWASDNPYGG